MTVASAWDCPGDSEAGLDITEEGVLLEAGAAKKQVLY